MFYLYCSVHCLKMPKVFYCSKYADEHPRPVGKKCQRDTAGESFSSVDEVAAPPSPSK